MTVQDCHVDGWTNPDGAIVLSSAPVLMFDCAFTGGPSGQPPVNMKAREQRLVVSENRVTSAPHVIRPGHTGRVYEVPPGKRHGSVTSAAQRFLRASAEIPGPVFDAKTDFGVQGDGRTDDTVAIQRTIDAAREHGAGAIAYLPTGRYNIHETLQITGGDFYVGGTGFRTSLVWRGVEGGTSIHVRDPQRVTLEHIAVGNHDAGQMNNAIDILQTGSERPSRMTYHGVSAYGMYQKRPNVKGLHFRGLTEHNEVIAPHVQGNLRFVDSARATVLLNCFYEGSIIVEGLDPRRGGFPGSMTRLATITPHGLYLRDNQNIVIGDFYLEQAMDGVILDQHYVPPMCSSTRACLLSGRYSTRFGLDGATNSRVFPFGMITLAAALQSLGYETGLTGKWHLGSTLESRSGLDAHVAAIDGLRDER